MPALTNPRHERFARYWMRKGVAAQAYLAAGYTPTTRGCLDVNASRLLRHTQVKRRIAELRKQMAARNRITVDGLIDELMADRDLARRLEQPATAITATMSAARLVGLLVDRRETGDPGAFAAQSEADVMATVRAELGEAAAAALATALARVEHQAEDEVDPLPPPLPTNEGSSTPN